LLIEAFLKGGKAEMLYGLDGLFFQRIVGIIFA